MGFFERVPLAPADPILGLTQAYQSDSRSTKVNLGVGLYKTEELKTPVLESVKRAEIALIEEEESKEYLPIDGERHYREEMGLLVFGKEGWSAHKGRIASFQSVGGTSALKIGGTFLKQEANYPVWISAPTWPNHRGVFTDCGLKVENYPYYAKEQHRFDFEGMFSCLEKLSAGSIVVLHASCHNPTGCDPSREQWKMLCALFQQKKLIPFFDFAYQGLGAGVVEDAEAVRLFLNSGIEMLIAVSNAKNLSIYGERVGCLFILSESAQIAAHIASRVKQVIRTDYSNPPMHGVKIAAHILSSPPLKMQWEAELREMRERIQKMRRLIAKQLAEKIPHLDFSHLANGTGMFGFTGLTKLQVEYLIKEHGIYMPSDGRMNVCGLNQSNVAMVASAIADAMRRKT